MGLTLNRLWLARTRRRIPSRSSSEATASTTASRDDAADGSSVDGDCFSLQERELPILDGGCPISKLPQDLLLRYVYTRGERWMVAWCYVSWVVVRERKEGREELYLCL